MLLSIYPGKLWQQLLLQQCRYYGNSWDKKKKSKIIKTQKKYGKKITVQKVVNNEDCILT